MHINLSKFSPLTHSQKLLDGSMFCIWQTIKIAVLGLLLFDTHFSLLSLTSMLTIYALHSILLGTLLPFELTSANTPNVKLRCGGST